MGEQMIIGLLCTSLAIADSTVDTAPSTTALSAVNWMELPQQSWEAEKEDDTMLQQHAQSQRRIKLMVLYGTAVLALGASGYGFYERGNKLATYDDLVLKHESLTHPEVEEALKEVTPFNLLAYGGLTAGLGVLGGGVAVQLKPTSMSIGFQF